MNQTVSTSTEATPEIEKKQGFIGRMTTAVCDKIVDWICENEMHLSPDESLIFMNYGGYGYDMNAMYHSIVRAKYDVEDS